MSDNQSQNDRKRRKPDQLAYNVKDFGNNKSYWSQVGAAYHHKDGKGTTIQLDSIPVDGKITLRDYAEQTMSNRDRSQSQSDQDHAQWHNRSYER